MRIINMIKDKKNSVAIKTEHGIIDLEETLKKYPSEIFVNNVDVMDVIQSEKTFELEKYLRSLPTDDSIQYIEEDEITWGPAITNPEKIICVGLNYRKHADETNSSYPETPILFTKYNNTLAGNLKEIKVPSVTKKLDYEVELGIVIGKEAKNVSTEEALDYVFGYVAVNDLSARDLQFVSSQWLLGKSCDDFSPVGPYLVTKDEIKDPNHLSLKTTFNGVLKQNSNTSDMIFNCEEIISYISKHMTLKPGDLILTGTPEGVIMGDPEDKQVYIQSGDTVTIEIEKLGKLKNTFIEE